MRCREDTEERPRGRGPREALGKAPDHWDDKEVNWSVWGEAGEGMRCSWED